MMTNDELKQAAEELARVATWRVDQQSGTWIVAELLRRWEVEREGHEAAHERLKVAQKVENELCEQRDRLDGEMRILEDYASGLREQLATNPPNPPKPPTPQEVAEARATMRVAVAATGGKGVKREPGWHYVRMAIWSIMWNDGQDVDGWIDENDDFRDDSDLTEIGPRVPTLEEWQAAQAFRMQFASLVDAASRYTQVYGGDSATMDLEREAVKSKALLKEKIRGEWRSKRGQQGKPRQGVAR